jgi:uncharacterized protein
MVDAVDEAIPTQDERTLATLSHVLQFVGGWIAPLVIFLVRRNSRFVSFHALQVLLLQGLYFIFVTLIGGALFIAVMVSVAFHQQVAQHAAPPVWGILLFLFAWLLLMGWWVFTLVIAIVFGIKTSKGQWARYPVLGSPPLKILKIGPNGESLG